MWLHSIALGLTRTRMGEELDVAEMRWRRPDLPSRMLFVETFVRIYERVELPSFPAKAWTEVETDMDVERVDIEDAVGDPEAIGRALWAFVLTQAPELG